MLSFTQTVSMLYGVEVGGIVKVDIGGTGVQVN